MKRNFKLFVFVFLFLLILLPKLNAESTIPFFDPLKTISLDFKDASLKDVLKALSIQSGLNFIATENVQDRQITLYLDRVPLKNMMDNLFKANNLDYKLDKDSNTFIVKDWGKLEVETVTKVFALKYATVSSSSLKEEMAGYIKSETTGGGGGGSGKWKIEEDTGITIAVKKLLSSYGSVIEDFRTNSLIVTDTPARIEIITKVIAALDVRVPQVMLEVEMLDVSKNVVDKMGIKFGQTPFKVSITGVSDASIGFPFKSWGKTFFTDTNRGKLSVNPDAFSAQLDFLRAQTDTKFLARPKILTSNNETAEIKITTQESVGVTTTTDAAGNSSAEVERAETGVSLRVTPQVNLESGEVTMFIYPKVAEAVTGNSFSTAAGTYTFRDPEERSTKSMVRVKDGETVVIGGLIRNEMTEILTKVPILGDIPIIGALFRHRGGSSTDSPKNKTRELLVFITPHIVKDSIGELAQAKKTTIPPREQSTASGVKRELTINASLNSFEKRNR